MGHYGKSLAASLRMLAAPMAFDPREAAALELGDVVDGPAIQSLMDSFHKVAPVPIGLLDREGKILAGAGWSDLCMRFHRVNPETCRKCLESDRENPVGVREGEHKFYRCKNNMWEVCTPVMVGGKHVGNLFSGQFFFKGEEPDRVAFREQARRYGFPEDDYMAALDRVPRVTREFMSDVLEFYLKLARSISEAGWSNLRLVRAAAERERTAAVLRLSERRLAHSQKMAHLGSWDLDFQTGRLVWSEEQHHIFGVTPGEFDGRFETFLSLVVAQDRRVIRETFERSLREGLDGYEVDFTITRASTKERRYIHAKCEHVRDASGRVVRSVGLAQDVTELKQREEQLDKVNRMMRARIRGDQAMLRATSEKQLLDEVCRIIVEDCGHAMVWVGWAEQDEGKTITPAAWAGFEDGYLSGLALTWADVERGRGPTGTAIRTGKPYICRDMLADPGFAPWRERATRRGYRSSVALPLTADGNAFGAITVYSRLPNAFTEEEVKLQSGLADDLAFGIGALRMREARKHAEARFQQAQKMEAVGLLAGGIAHDFNNILASIVGYNSLLLDGLRGSHLRKFSLEIKRASELAARLTQQLLGVSGNRGAQRRMLDPNSVITAMGKMLRRLVGEKIRLELKLHDSVWPLMMDSGQLEQIVMNLAVNARDAMPKGGRLTVTTRNIICKRGRRQDAGSSGPLPGRCVEIEVRDTGTGMGPDVLARIFEPFFTTKGPGRGTGLGLSTIKTIVEEYQGTITVDSAPGRGTAFRVLLPSVGGASRKSAQAGSIRKSHRGHETVLVLEDNASLLAIIKATLRRAGYSVLCARTAEEAQSAHAKGKKDIDLLLSDVVLPDMDGPELAKRLKEAQPSLRVVYMSGYPGNALGPVAGFGGCVLLEKPFSPAQLLSALRQVLDAEQADLF